MMIEVQLEDYDVGTAFKRAYEKVQDLPYDPDKGSAVHYDIVLKRVYLRCDDCDNEYMFVYEFGVSGL